MSGILDSRIPTFRNSAWAEAKVAEYILLTYRLWVPSIRRRLSMIIYFILMILQYGVIYVRHILGKVTRRRRKQHTLHESYKKKKKATHTTGQLQEEVIFYYCHSMSYFVKQKLDSSNIHYRKFTRSRKKQHTLQELISNYIIIFLLLWEAWSSKTTPNKYQYDGGVHECFIAKQYFCWTECPIS